MADPKTEGHRLLLALADPPARICAKLAVPKATLAHWRSGAKRPSAEWRAELSRAYGIPIGAWDRAPGSADPPPAAPGSRPPSNGAALSVIERVDAELARLDVEREAATVAIDKHRLSSSIYKLLDKKAELEHVAALSEDRFVREHPAWKRTRVALLEALKPYPDALRAVIAALERVHT